MRAWPWHEKVREGRAVWSGSHGTPAGQRRSGSTRPRPQPLRPRNAGRVQGLGGWRGGGAGWDWRCSLLDCCPLDVAVRPHAQDLLLGDGSHAQQGQGKRRGTLRSWCWWHSVGVQEGLPPCIVGGSHLVSFWVLCISEMQQCNIVPTQHVARVCCDFRHS